MKGWEPVNGEAWQRLYYYLGKGAKSRTESSQDAEGAIIDAMDAGPILSTIVQRRESSCQRAQIDKEAACCTEYWWDNLVGRSDLEGTRCITWQVSSSSLRFAVVYQAGLSTRSTQSGRPYEEYGNIRKSIKGNLLPFCYPPVRKIVRLASLRIDRVGVTQCTPQDI